MTPSIIRRFARYHGRHYAITHPSISADEAIADLANCLRTTERNIIQSLTRIEDAEHCWRRSAMRYFNRTDAEREEAAIVAAELFAKADIDPAKWHEVKDEEA